MRCHATELANTDEKDMAACSQVKCCARLLCVCVVALHEVFTPCIQLLVLKMKKGVGFLFATFHVVNFSRVIEVRV